jgi:hypothetical protein
LAAMSAQATPLTPKLLGPIIYMPNQEWAPLPNDPASLAPVAPCRRRTGGAGTATTGVTGGATGIGAVASRIGDLELEFPRETGRPAADPCRRVPSVPWSVCVGSR